MSTHRAAVLRGALAGAAAVALLACLVPLPVASPANGTSVAAPPVVAAGPGPVCGLWYGIGDTPTPEEIELAAERYQVVVLNAWETDTLHRLHTLNPDITVLVYKDLPAPAATPAPSPATPTPTTSPPASATTPPNATTPNGSPWTPTATASNGTGTPSTGR